MSAAPRPLDRFGFVCMATLCGSWGFNQVAAKLALADFAPVTQSALRSAIGSLILLIYAAGCRRAVFRSDRTLGPGIVIGLLFGFEFIALFEAVKMTTAASAVVFLYTAPFFVALGALAFLPAERLRPRQWAGMALAFLGVAAGLYRAAPGASLAGDWLALAAGGLWGATTVVVRATRLRTVDPLKTLLYQTVVGAIVSLVWASAIGEPWPTHVELIPALSLAYQSIWVVGFTYIVWFWLLTVYRAPELSAFTFTTPVVGVFAGWLALGEPLTASFLAALALVAAGIVMVNWPAAAARRPRSQLGGNRVTG